MTAVASDDWADVRPPRPAAEKIRRNHGRFRLFILLGVAIYVVAGLLMAAIMPPEMMSHDFSTQQQAGRELAAKPLVLLGIMVAGLLSMAGFGLLVTGVVFQMILHHQCWAVLADDRPRTTPGRAVGFLFIPVFNIWWLIPSLIGLDQDQRRALAARGLSAPATPAVWTWLLMGIFTVQIPLLVWHWITPSTLGQVLSFILVLPATLLFVLIHARTGRTAALIAEHDAGREDRTP
jgi:hypothetical protein